MIKARLSKDSLRKLEAGALEDLARLLEEAGLEPRLTLQGRHIFLAVPDDWDPETARRIFQSALTRALRADRKRAGEAKGTSLAFPEHLPGDVYHGGDAATGETDHPSPGDPGDSSPNPGDSSRDTGEREKPREGSGEGDDPASSSSSSSSSSTAGGASGGDGGGEGERERAGSSGSSTSSPEFGEEVEILEPEEAEAEESSAPPGGSGAGSPSLYRPPASPYVLASGREAAELWETVWSPPPDLVRRAQALMARALLLAARGGVGRGGMGAENEPGPRWDPARVSVRVAGWLRPLRPEDRRMEGGEPSLLVLPDVSGSMAPVHREVLWLAGALARTSVGRHMVVVPHENGVPVGIWEPPAAPRAVRWPHSLRWGGFSPEVMGFYRVLCQRRRIVAAIIFADWHGEWAFRGLAALGVHIFWADPWGSSWSRPRAVPFPPRWAVRMWPKIRGEWGPLASRVRYAFGCRDAESFISALEQMLLQGGE